MIKMINLWRWYTLGREQYNKCMKKTFSSNLLSLRQANMVALVLTVCFTVVNLVIDKDIDIASGHLTAAAVSLLLIVYVNYKLKQVKQRKQTRSFLIYLLITAYYANVTVFGINLGVWSNPGNYAVTFMCILICALFLFINPPIFNLCLTIAAITLFIIFDINVKPPGLLVTDIVNVLCAGSISLFFCWQITRLRIVSILNVSKLEDERNKYYDESTIDELTQMRNRRDYIQTFQRYLSSYRSSDDWLCIAIADIDFFKYYNDFYGHPKGDECLRAIGGALNSLRESMSVYAARIGGEEFAMLWFEKDISHADTVVAHITKIIKDLQIPHEQSKASQYITLSIGIRIEQCGSLKSLDELYDLADKALYTAKNSGRNCTIISGEGFSQYRIPPA